MEAASRQEASEEGEANTPMLDKQVASETGAGENPVVEEVEAAQLPLPLDRGYAWVIMVASMCNNFIIDGIANTYCELLVDFIDHFADAPKSSLSLIGSLLCGVYLMSGPIAGGLVNKFGCRATCMLGSVIACLAFLGSSFAGSVLVLTLLYGVIGGIGLGLMYLPSIVIVNFYFRKRRSLAVGLAVCGTGIGTMVMGPVVRLLLEHFGWQNSLMILAGFVLNGAVFGALMRPIDVLDDPVEGEKDTSSKRVAVTEASANSGRQVPGQKETALNETAPSKSDRNGGVDSLVKKYIRNVSQAANSPTTAAPVEKPGAEEAGQNVPPDDDDPRKRTNSDSQGIRYKRNQVKQPQQQHLKAAAESGGGKTPVTDGFMESSPDIWQMREIRVRQRGETTGAASTDVSASAAAKKISRSRLEEVRRPLNQKDIFLSSSIYDLAQQIDPKLKCSLKDVSQADLFLSMTRLSQAVDTGDQADGAIGADSARGGWRDSKPFKYALSLMTNFSLLKELSYMIIIAANLVGMIAFYIPGFFISDYAKEAGVPASLTPTLISAYGGANTVARIAFGFLAGNKRFSPLVINNLTIIITGVFVSLLVACRGYVSMVTVFSLYGFFSAPYISLTSVILCQLIGLENVTSGFGLLVLARGLTSSCGPPIGGSLYTQDSGYAVPFLVSGGLFVLCGLMHCLLHLPRFRRQEAENTEDILKSLQSLASSKVQL